MPDIRLHADFEFAVERLDSPSQMIQCGYFGKIVSVAKLFYEFRSQ